MIINIIKKLVLKEERKIYKKQKNFIVQLFKYSVAKKILFKKKLIIKDFK